MMKRIGIFLLYDTKGRVYEYVEYLLQQIRPCLEELVIVSNGFLLEESREALHKYTPKILERPNVGFDAAGWREGMLEYCGMDYIRDFDELVLFNDSFFGPFYPFQKIFDEMDARDIDFWGISSHGAAPSAGHKCPYGDRPRYIQTYFMCFRNTVLQADSFETYWRELPCYKTFSDLVEKHACAVTQHFADLGFRWDVLCDTRELESEEIRKNYSHHMFDSYFMVSEKKLPILKRKTFIMEKSSSLRFGMTDSLRKALRYVEKNTDYDIRLIWDYLLDKYNLYDLKQSLNLTCVLDARLSAFTGVAKPTAFIAYLFHEDLFESCLRNIKSVPEGIDIYLVTTAEAKKEKLAEACARLGIPVCDILAANTRGRELSALLVSCRAISLKYTYLCFYHDGKAPEKEYASVGADFGKLRTQCILGTRAYILNILELFEQNPRLGLLVPPIAYHGSYFADSKNYWGRCYDEARNLLSRLNLNEFMIEKQKPPISVATAFWCRVDALKPLFSEEWAWEDFPKESAAGGVFFSRAMERCFPYIAQSQKYYTCTLMPSEYAETEITNFRYMMEETEIAMRGVREINYTTFDTFVRSIRIHNKRGNTVWKRLMQRKPAISPSEYHAFVLKCKAVVPSPLWNVMKKCKSIFFQD